MNTTLPRALGLAALLAATAACASTGSDADAGPMADHTASYIEMNAAPGRTRDLAEFLAGAAPIVADTEPGTALWFALQAPQDRLAIFDVFVDEAARDAHFSGAVAAALEKNASELVDGGWEDGVLPGVFASDVLSVKAPVDLERATTATYIPMRAAPGRADELAELLAAGGAIVAETEPGTLFWAGLRIDEERFAIFDVFADEAGRQAHFAGQVAALLAERAPDIVDGGWEDGVVANVDDFDIIAIR